LLHLSFVVDAGVLGACFAALVEREEICLFFKSCLNSPLLHSPSATNTSVTSNGDRKRKHKLFLKANQASKASQTKQEPIPKDAKMRVSRRRSITGNVAGA
jgi:hypothetical protein